MATQVTPPVEPQSQDATPPTEEVADTSSPSQETVLVAPKEAPAPEVAPQSNDQAVKRQPKLSKLDQAVADYQHTPGTTHVNAYVAALDEAKAELVLAEGKVAEAEQALKAKLGL